MGTVVLRLHPELIINYVEHPGRCRGSTPHRESAARFMGVLPELFVETCVLLLRDEGRSAKPALLNPIPLVVPLARLDAREFDPGACRLNA